MNLLSPFYAMRDFLRLPVIGQPPLSTLASPPGLEFNGALPNMGGLAAALTGVINSSVAGSIGPFSTTAGATATLTSLQQTTNRFTSGGAVTVTLDSAYNIANALQYPYNGQSFWSDLITIAATTIATPTLSDTAVTLSGTTSLAASTLRRLQGQVTQLYTTVGAPMTAGTTFTSIAQVGATNNFTVTLATNALVPVVGQVIYLNVTAGTLPAGWYPINKVTSATSFVIATPPGTVWTATAATVPGTTLVPSSQYSTGSPSAGSAGGVGVYSPLVTITSMWSVVTASA